MLNDILLLDPSLSTTKNERSQLCEPPTSSQPSLTSTFHPHPADLEDVALGRGKKRFKYLKVYGCARNSHRTVSHAIENPFEQVVVCHGILARVPKQPGQYTFCIEAKEDEYVSGAAHECPIRMPSVGSIIPE
jgi:hypothetical protein